MISFLFFWDLRGEGFFLLLDYAWFFVGGLVSAEPPAAGRGKISHPTYLFVAGA